MGITLHGMEEIGRSLNITWRKPVSNIKVTSPKCISAANNSFNDYIRVNYHIAIYVN